LHRELGYRGIVLYPFTSKSTYYEDGTGNVRENIEHMYVTILLSDVNTRAHIEKYLTIMMVHHDGNFASNINVEGNDASGLKTGNIVRMPLPGFDVVNHIDVRPLMRAPVSVMETIRAPYMELFFNEEDHQNVPNNAAIQAWKKCYDLHNESYTLRYKFQDDGLLAEFFIYPYDVFTSCEDRSKHINCCYRYRLNVSTDGLDDTPDASLVVGPILWRLRGSNAKEGDQEVVDATTNAADLTKLQDMRKASSNAQVEPAKKGSEYVFFTRSDYHNPVQLTHRRRSAQFNGDLFLPKRLDSFQVTPLLVCRFLGTTDNADKESDTRTFQYPPFQLKMATYDSKGETPTTPGGLPDLTPK